MTKQHVGNSRQDKEKVHVTFKGFLTKESCEPFFKDYEIATKGIDFADYNVVIHCKEMSVFPQDVLPYMVQGYEIKSPSKREFDQTLCDIYHLLIELYRTFPIYKHISKEEFTSIYSYLEKLIRYNTVMMAYFKGKAVGFFVSLPNYKNMIYGKLSLIDCVKILKIRARPKDYVMLYMGVDFSHKGLGKAIAETVKEELKKAGTPSVGALIRQGNINIDYFENLIEYDYQYVLLDLTL